MPLSIYSNLIALDAAINILDEVERRAEPDGPQHQPKGITGHPHISEKEARLHEPCHPGLEAIVVNAVPHDKDPR